MPYTLYSIICKHPSGFEVYSDNALFALNQSYDYECAQNAHYVVHNDNMTNIGDSNTFNFPCIKQRRI